MIKITGGKFKRKQLDTISKFVRPTSSLKREAFFSVLESYGMKYSHDFFNNKIFLDLYAGIGTMGLEAISRGVKSVIFYENNPEVIKILKKNCMKVCKREEYKIIEEDLQNINIDINFQNISVIYIDPPYHKYNLNDLLNFLQKKIRSNTIIGVETGIKDNFNIPNRLDLIKQKKYGKTKLSFLLMP